VPDHRVDRILGYLMLLTDTEVVDSCGHGATD
jgi:hypothetical protein